MANKLVTAAISMHEAEMKKIDEEAKNAINEADTLLTMLNAKTITDEYYDITYDFVDSIYQLEENDETNQFEKTNPCKYPDSIGKPSKLSLADRYTFAPDDTSKKLYGSQIKLTYQTYLKNKQMKDVELGQSKNKEMLSSNPQKKTTLAFKKEKCSEKKAKLQSQQQQSISNLIGTTLANINASLGQELSDLKEVPKCIDSFLKELIQGFFIRYGQLSAKSFDADALIQKMMDMLNKLLAADAVIPPPPGLSDLMQIFTILQKLKPDDSLSKPVGDIEIPPSVWSSIWGITQSVSILIGALPVVLIKLIFNMIKAICEQIENLGGSLPYPLNLVSDAIDIVPAVYDAILFMAPTIRTIIEEKIKGILIQMKNLKMPSVSGLMSIFQFENLPPCPAKKQSKTQLIGLLTERINAIEDTKKTVTGKKENDLKIVEDLDYDPDAISQFTGEIEQTAEEQISKLDQLEEQLKAKLATAESDYETKHKPLDEKISALKSQIASLLEQIKNEKGKSNSEVQAEVESNAKKIQAQIDAMYDQMYEQTVNAYKSQTKLANDVINKQRKDLATLMAMKKNEDYLEAENNDKVALKFKQDSVTQLEAQVKTLQGMLEAKKKSFSAKKCSKCGKQPPSKYCPFN